MTHSITENLDDIMIEQQGILATIGIENIEDLAAPRSWRSISYAHAKVQEINNICYI